MKTILFLRHAKSDWNAAVGGDHERPLAPRGRGAARLMGRFLASQKRLPDLALTSTAERARDTLRLAMEAGGWTCPVEETRRIYEAVPEGVVDLIREQDDACESLLLVGHEPTFSAVTGRLAGGGDVRFPTAALAHIDFAEERWSRVGFGGGRLAWLVTPKILARWRDLENRPGAIS